jgi:hypothetical protein
MKRVQVDFQPNETAWLCDAGAADFSPPTTKRPPAAAASARIHSTAVFALAEIAGGTIGQRRDQGLIPIHNLAKGVPIAAEAFRHQIGIAELYRGHRFDFHRIAS